MKQPTLRQKFALIFLGVFLSVMILECLLRMCAGIFLFSQERRNKITLSKEGAYRIMCLGESTTALGGEHSYPSQLEKALNAASDKMKFSVINKGMPGARIDAIAENLGDYLERYRPDMVLTMLGVNDEYLIGNKIFYGKPGDPRVYKCFNFLKDSLNISKINLPASREAERYFDLAQRYGARNEKKRAVKACVKSLRLNPLNAEACIFLANFYNLKLIEPVLRRHVKKFPDVYPVFLNMGQWYRDSGDIERAVDCFKTVLEFDRASEKAYWAYFELGGCYRTLKDYRRSEEMYKRAISMDSEAHNAYRGLALCYENEGRKKLAEKNFTIAKQLNLRTYMPNVKKRYLSIKNALKEKKIAHVAVQYPMRSVESLKKTLDYDSYVVFVDNREIFKNALREASYDELFSDSFGGDFGHCTPKGNALLAENISGVILAEFFK